MQNICSHRLISASLVATSCCCHFLNTDVIYVVHYGECIVHCCVCDEILKYDECDNCFITLPTPRRKLDITDDPVYTSCRTLLQPLQVLERYPIHQ